MKRPEPWKQAKKAADNAAFRELMKQRAADRERASEETEYDPMAIHWGNVKPPRPAPNKRGKRKP
jgi:hypothetical protein